MFVFPCADKAKTLFEEWVCAPAFKKVNSGLTADLSQIPEPHLSHQARVISFPLSPFCTYCLDSGLEILISAVLTIK